ncbi:MAG TPA: galactokinase [Chthoniobacterales bacterium]|nr:galactokinase [Chthoniobacterales bacterium]
MSLNYAPGDAVFSADAPGRVEILGNHTDYNEGVVLAAAVDRTVRVRGNVRSDGRILLRSTLYPAVEIAISQLRPIRGESQWANYPLGVVSELAAAGIPIRGFSAVIETDLPARIGLGSSAALGVATAFFLLKLHRCALPPMEIAKVCQRSEHRFIGIESGLLDQVASIFAKRDQLVFFDCRAEEVRPISFPDDLALVVADSGTQRQLAQSEYNRRRKETRAAAAARGARSLRDVSSAQLNEDINLPPLLRSRAAHVISENDRVWHAIDVLKQGDATALGDLMNASHESSRVNFENSTPELDRLVDLARQQQGVLGARLTGAGFGGAIVVLCKRRTAHGAARALAAAAAQTLVCRPADGALARN